MRFTVLLFDIDGTLLASGGAGGRSIHRAFRRRFGRAAALRFSFGGMTDRAIVRDGLLEFGLTLDGEALEREIDGVLEIYLEELRDEYARADGVRKHSGVDEALAAAREAPNTAIGLGTGNIKRGAFIKLERVGLHQTFRFGGFGCDHIERATLLRIGAERGAKELGVPLSDCRVVVIGDTYRDVAAAKAIGAECLAVATGGQSVEELTRHEPTHVFSDLGAQGALDALLARW